MGGGVGMVVGSFGARLKGRRDVLVFLVSVECKNDWVTA